MYINLRNLYTSLSLEDFSFEREFWNKFFIYNICASITLNISQYDFEILDHEDNKLKPYMVLDCKVEINALAFEYFNFNGHLSDIAFLKKLDNLV